MATFSERLKQLRIESGMTQPELAQKLKMSNGAIGNYESGKRMPRIEDIEAFADFFNVDLNYILGHSNKRLDFTLEQIWIMECYKKVTDENDKIAIKAILKKYDN